MGQELLMTNEAHQECGTGPEAGLVGVTLRALRVVGRLPGGLRNREKKKLLLLLLSHFSHVRLCVTQWTAAHQTPLSLGFSRQEHVSGLPFPSLMHESEK